MKKIVVSLFLLSFLISCQPKESGEIENKEEALTVETSEVLVSTLEIIDIETKERTVVYSSETHFEAPNWSRNGDTLLFNSKGELYKISIKGGEPIKVNTSFATDCNNDHLISPDGSQIAISHHLKENHESKIFILPYNGGEPKLVTEKGPSYLHGWSPDGKTVVYCAEREGDYNVFAIDTAGGEEVQLTNVEGLDDGPEYGPNGEYIYFNSERSGRMKIWRMDMDGSNQTQLTFDDNNDWFAHIAPNNKKMIFISYDTTVAAGNHPPNKNVCLRIMSMEKGDQPEVLLELFGGQGTINVPSWSPNSEKVAFVSYKFEKKNL